MWSASSSPTGSTATKLLRRGHSRRSVSTGDPGGLIEGFRRHGPPQGRLIWLPEQSTTARASAPSCSSMKSPASYGRLMAKRSCATPTLWPNPIRTGTMPVSTRLLAPFLENRKSESTTATVATFQHAQAEKSRESQLSQGASLKTEIVTKPKVAGVAGVATPWISRGG